MQLRTFEGAFKETFNVTCEERDRIDEKTRYQSQSLIWHAERAGWITRSRCSKILSQTKKTDALFISILYPKHTTDHKRLSLPLKWGIENEHKALGEYVTFMRSNGHPHLWTESCGFTIHPTQGWLGASPDAVVIDPSVEKKKEFWK